MLRRLPRALGRLASRSTEASSVRALHALPGARAVTGAHDAGSGRATIAVSALAATALLSSSAAAAEEAPAVATPPPNPAEALKGLKSLADAKEIVLYQYEVCPFCNKARRARMHTSCRVLIPWRPSQLKAFLDFHKIPYKVVEVNPLSKKELKWSTYGKARPQKHSTMALGQHSSVECCSAPAGAGTCG